MVVNLQNLWPGKIYEWINMYLFSVVLRNMGRHFVVSENN